MNAGEKVVEISKELAQSCKSPHEEMSEHMLMFRTSIAMLMTSLKIYGVPDAEVRKTMEDALDHTFGITLEGLQEKTAELHAVGVGRMMRMGFDTVDRECPHCGQGATIFMPPKHLEHEYADTTDTQCEICGQLFKVV